LKLKIVKNLLIICPQIASPHITKNKWFANRKSGTYTRTAHLCLGESPSIGHATSFLPYAKERQGPYRQMNAEEIMKVENEKIMYMGFLSI
jgi:hypothetical protein